MGERREEENGRRGYGKRAGTSCEVRAARREIASFAIDRTKKGRRTSAGVDLPPLLGVVRPVGNPATRTRTPRVPVVAAGARRHSVRPPIRTVASIRRLKKKRSRAEFSRRKGSSRQRGKHDTRLLAPPPPAAFIPVPSRFSSPAFSSLLKRACVRARVSTAVAIASSRRARSPSVRILSACDD